MQKLALAKSAGADLVALNRRLARYIPKHLFGTIEVVSISGKSSLVREL